MSRLEPPYVFNSHLLLQSCLSLELIMIATFIPINFKGEPFLGTRLYVSFYATISLGCKHTVAVPDCFWAWFRIYYAPETKAICIYLFSFEGWESLITQIWTVIFQLASVPRITLGHRKRYLMFNCGNAHMSTTCFGIDHQAWAGIRIILEHLLSPLQSIYIYIISSEISALCSCTPTFSTKKPSCLPKVSLPYNRHPYHSFVLQRFFIHIHH